LLSKLKILKKKIDTNIVELEKISPYSKDISDAIGILMRKSASDTMVKIWMNGVLELAKDVEIALKIIEKKEKVTLENNNNINPKDKLKKLQTLIIIHIEELIIEYPHTLLIYEAMEELIRMDASESLIQSWLKSIDDFVALLDTKSGI
jgi:DNA-binding protein YbaB